MLAIVLFSNLDHSIKTNKYQQQNQVINQLEQIRLKLPFDGFTYLIINNFIDMNNTQNRQVRATSARQPVLRPQSSKNRQLHQKTEFIQNTYISQKTQNNMLLPHKNKLFSMRGIAPQSGLQDVSKLIPPPQKMTKERQQLFQQNMHLKKQLHRLRQQLNKNKTKIQTLTSKNQKYTKQFNRQFQKKIYWNGNGNNAYLISGIKAQYQKLKQQYDDKNAQNQALKKQLIQSRAPEYKVYAQTLEDQNKRLAQKIQKMAEISENALFDGDGQKTINEYMYVDLKNKKQKIQSKFKKLLFQLDTIKGENKENKKKIQFLEKLLIQKDNCQYHASKKAKKLERQRHVQEQKIRQLEGRNQDIERIYSDKIQKMKLLQDKRFRTEKDMFERALNQKQIKITKLQKQIAYLSTLLTYWKPLDELNKDYNDKYMGQMDDQRSISKKDDDNKRKNEDPVTIQNITKKTRRPTEYDIKNPQKGDFILKASGDLSNELRQSAQLEIGHKGRVQQTADHRNSDQAEKKRKIDYKQIQHLGEHLRYRFLGLRLKMNDIRKYFDYHKESTNPQNNFILAQNAGKGEEDQNKWQEEYITMKQTKQVLRQYPFELSEQDSHMLARYLIEDSNNQHVYMDLNNEHKRNVVKSIIKALVGNYQVLQGDRQIQIQQQCKQMLDKYQSNLISALSTMASSGFISRRKFVELLSSLGIELSEEGRDFLVCKMLLKSESLNKLGYMIIFD